MGYIGKNLDVTYHYCDLLRMAISWTSDFVMSTCCKSLLFIWAAKNALEKRRRKFSFLFFFFFFFFVGCLLFLAGMVKFSSLLYFLFFDPFSVASWFIHNPIYIWLDTVWFIDGWYINWRRKGRGEQFLPLNVYIGTLGCTKWLATRPFRFYWHAKVSNWLFAELAYYWGANPFQIPWIGRCDWL